MPVMKTIQHFLTPISTTKAARAGVFLISLVLLIPFELRSGPMRDQGQPSGKPEGGVTIKKREKHTKPDPNTPCPCLAPGYTISPRELVNEASIRDWAHHGVLAYQAMLGEILLFGKLAERDPQEAHYWLKCAAQAGHVEAMALLALQLYNGDGVPRNLPEVLKWATRAAEAGNMPAQHLLGNMYALAEGVAQDFALAIKWHTLAAEQGNVDVQAALGYRYLAGDGVAKDLPLAIKWLSLAAENGHAEAAENLKRALLDKGKE